MHHAGNIIIKIDVLSDTEQLDNSNTSTTEHKVETQSLNMLCSEIDNIDEDMKNKLKDESFASGVKKFVSTYQKLSSRLSNASLVSSLHRFGWCFGGAVTSMKGEILRRGRHIPIQARSAKEEKEQKGRRYYDSWASSKSC